MKNIYIIVVILSNIAYITMIQTAMNDKGVACMGIGCPKPPQEGSDTDKGYQRARGYPATQQGYDVSQYPTNKEYNISRGYRTEKGYNRLSSGGKPASEGYPEHEGYHAIQGYPASEDYPASQTGSSSSTIYKYPAKQGIPESTPTTSR